ncbi:MAG: hypothetical protein JXA33_27615 [Anaerolineae bacterium]|nr:hypothetical protein [Anaerolineae bacterium]
MILVQNAPDQDNDYIPDMVECLTEMPDCAAYDTDSDGIDDYLDNDSDNDGISDTAEWITDINQDGIIDGYDRDRNVNQIWDFQEYNEPVFFQNIVGGHFLRTCDPFLPIIQCLKKH